MFELTAEESDAINEVFNIAMGRAAHSLSQLMRAEVGLSIPDLDCLSMSQVEKLLSTDSDDSMCAVHEKFSGSFGGNALLVFPSVDSFELVRAIFPDTDEAQLDSISELEQEALLEVGNIILNACVGSIANLTGASFSTEIPVLLQGSAEEILLRARRVETDEYLFMRMRFRIQVRSMLGYVAFVMDIPSLEAFREYVRKAFLADPE